MFSRANIAFMHDTFWAPVSLLAALYLRVGGDALPSYLPMLKVALPLFTLVAPLIFLATGMHRGVWRYASTRDLMAISRAVGLSILVFLPLLFAVNRLEGMPRSLPFIHALVLLMGLGGPRFLFRVLKDRRQARRGLDHTRINVLLVGADDQADIFIRYCGHHPDAGYRVVGIVSRDGNRVGREILGVPVLGLVDEVAEVVERLTRKGLPPQRVILSPDFPPASGCAGWSTSPPSWD
ncbi:MAG: hypothetical protein NVV74_04720 [Magnetospirillum sp.]|nr:hypothetical protein [Magnetospirillum sp.]